MPAQRTQREFADVILGMTYGDLMEVAGAFADMTDKKNGARPVHTKTPQDFASLLHDWAEAQADD